MFVIYPYSNKSKGAKALAAALNATLLTGTKAVAFAEGPSPKPHIFINWGTGSLANGLRKANGTVINDVKGVNISRNKLKFFNAQVASKTPARVPTYTDEIDKAMEWVEAGIVVMGRNVTGSCGTDIAFFEDDVDKFNTSDFWVQYKKKKEEYRIHIFKGNVIAAQKKALRETDPMTNEPIDNSNVDFRIRNHKNGFIFKRQDLSVPGDVVDQAVLAMANTGLDFGAVDVIWNQFEGKAYVLEINTAPGLEGTTVTDYATAFKQLVA